MKKYAICIGREFCSGGREIGKMLAKRLGIAYYDEIELRDPFVFVLGCYGPVFN